MNAYVLNVQLELRVMKFFMNGLNSTNNTFQFLSNHVCMNRGSTKILEKLFNERLDKFIDKFQLLNNCQYGFISQMYTSHALMHRRTGRGGAGGGCPPPPIRAVCRHEFGQRVYIIRAKHNTCLNNTNLGSVTAVNGGKTRI